MSVPAVQLPTIEKGETLVEVKNLVKHFNAVHKCYSACRVCLKAVGSTKELIRHKLMMHPDCRECKRVFDTPFALYYHRKAVHPPSEQLMNLLRSEGKVYKQCAVCGMVFSKRSYLLTHEKALHGRQYSIDS